MHSFNSMPTMQLAVPGIFHVSRGQCQLEKTVGIFKLSGLQAL